MSDLSEFLLARIAEDEAEAMNATAAIGDDGHWFGSPAKLRKVFSVTLTEVARSAVPRHIARHDPARVLRRCEADRRIVESCRVDYEDSLTSGDDGTTLAEEVLHALALPYADHRDYREEWRP